MEFISVQKSEPVSDTATKHNMFGNRSFVVQGTIYLKFCLILPGLPLLNTLNLSFILFSRS